MTPENSIWFHARRTCQNLYDYGDAVRGRRLKNAISRCERGRITLASLSQQADAIEAEFTKAQLEN